MFQAHWRGSSTRKGTGLVRFEPYDGLTRKFQRHDTIRLDKSSFDKFRKLEGHKPPSADAKAPAAAATKVLAKEKPDGPLQAAGHGILVRGPPGTIIKDGPPCELAVYRALKGTNLEPYVPALHSFKESGQICTLTVEDLTAGFAQCCVMDIKIGKRTFLESEVKKSTLRPDLAKKMEKLDPSALNDHQKQHGITKLQYMQFRENKSSTYSLGFRIEGIHTPAGSFGSTKEVREWQEVQRALEHFLQGSACVRDAYLVKLEDLRLQLELSAWFREFEMVGSSILFTYEPQKGESRCKMIDFAKTERIPAGEIDEGRFLSHREDWRIGNHEEGYLTGLDNLIDVWRSLRCPKP